MTDEFGGYALAIGGLWALAFGLTTGAHVRIDVLLPHFPPAAPGGAELRGARAA